MSKKLEWYRDENGERVVKWRGNTDQEIADLVVETHTRTILDIQSSCEAAHDRILALSQNREKLESIIKAAKYLILAATGPEGGPTSWNQTRDDWLALVADEGIDTE